MCQRVLRSRRRRPFQQRPEPGFIGARIQCQHGRRNSIDLISQSIRYAVEIPPQIVFNLEQLPQLNHDRILGNEPSKRLAVSHSYVVGMSYLLTIPILQEDRQRTLP